MFAVLLLLQTGASYQSSTDSGVSRQLDVRIPRFEDVVKIDGVLDEPVWNRAAVLTGFSQYRPVDGRPADDSTAVLVWYASDAIYFGIRAYEAHGHVVRATLADRDNIDADDRIEILLDTYLDHRRATMFAVNPLGVQEDGVWSDGVGAGAAGGPSAGGRLVGLTQLRRGLVLDLTPEFTTKVDGAPTSAGYDYWGTPEVAGTVRWGLTQNLSMTGTANPDFSQVEADVGQVTLNQRFALF